MRTTRRRIPAGTMAPDMPIMMVQRSPSICFQTSNARPSCLPWNAVPCMRVRISVALVAPTGSNGRVGVDRMRDFRMTSALLQAGWVWVCFIFF